MRLLAAIFLLCGSVVAFADPPNPSQWHVSFQDEFTNSYGSSIVDSSKWYVPTGAFGTNFVDNPGTELQTYQFTNVIVSSGILQLWARHDNSVYTGGKITGWTNFWQKYGYWEARLTVDKIQNLWPVWWTLKSPYTDFSAAESDWPPEIDIFEAPGMSGGPLTDIAFKVWYGPNYPNSGGGSGSSDAIEANTFTFDAGFDMTAAFHTYGVLWTNTGFTYYIDGTSIGTTTAHPFTKYDMFPIAQLGIFNGTVGTLPAKMQVDWIRIWSYGTTNADPYVTTQPVSQTVQSGSTATFTISSASNQGLTVTNKWSWYGTNVGTGNSWTTPTLTAANSGSTVYVMVSDTNGVFLTSNAVLTVTVDPVDQNRLPPGGTWEGIVGVSNGIPNRTTVYTNFATSATVAMINSALSTCPSNQVVLLTNGTFTINGSINIAKNGVTLRGATNANGSAATVLNFSSSSFVSVQNNSWNYDAPSQFSNININSGTTRGSTAIVVASTPTGLSAGMTFVLTAPGNIPTIEHQHAGDFADWNASVGVAIDHPFSSIHKVTSVSGTTINFWPAINEDYLTNGTMQVHYRTFADQIVLSGIESCVLTNQTGFFNQFTVDMQGADECWVKNCKIYGVGQGGQPNAGIRFYVCFNCEARHNWTHNAADFGASEYGIVSVHGCGILVEDNVFDTLPNVWPMIATSRSVFAYNIFTNEPYQSANFLSQIVFSHGAHDHFNLYEGNWIPTHYNDDYNVGNYSHSRNNTYFRERLTGYDGNGPKSSNCHCVTFCPHHDNMTVAGCVMGTATIQSQYQQTSGTVGGNNSIFNYDSGVSGTTLNRFANYNIIDSGIHSTEVLQSTQALATSYIHSSKPAWWGQSQPWPWVDPSSFSQANTMTNFPAGYRYVTGNDVPTGGGGGGPTISVQPQNTTVRQGDTATFTVTATSSGGTLHYQWTFQGVNVGTDSSSYSRANCALADSGGGAIVTVSDDNGSIGSSTATLTVTPTVFFVSRATGSTANNGTDPSTPWPQIGYAMGQITATNTVIVMDGNYTNFTITKQYTTLIASNKWMARVTNGPAHNILGNDGISGITVRGFEVVTSTLDGIKIAGTNCLIADNHVIGAGDQGISGHESTGIPVSDNIITRNLVEWGGSTNGVTLDHDQGIYIGGRHNAIFGNVARFNAAYGIQNFPEDGMSNHQNTIAFNLVYSNNMANIFGGGIVVYANNSTNVNATNWVYGNTIYEPASSDGCIKIARGFAGVTNNLMQGNIILEAAGAGEVISNGYNVATASISPAGLNNVVTNNMHWLDTSKGKFWLNQVNGAALSTVYYPTDFFGNTIGSVSDSGAFQYNSSYALDGRNLSTPGSDFWAGPSIPTKIHVQGIGKQINPGASISFK